MGLHLLHTDTIPFFYYIFPTKTATTLHSLQIIFMKKNNYLREKK